MAIELTHHWTIVCEGFADKAFFSRLIQERGLPSFNIPFPNDETKGGRNHFSEMLKALRASSKYSQLSAILIVSDNDNNPAASFREVREQIQIAIGYPVPNTPMQVARATGQPAILVMMLPWIHTPGCLESLCRNVLAQEQGPMMECVEEFLRCAGVTDWGEIQKRDKAAVQCFISGSNQEDPNKSLRYLLEGRSPLIPMNVNEFNEIANALQNFGSLVAG